MELVHKLNPDGVEAEPKIYRHPIPDDKFEELKKGCPEANLTEKPNIYFQYYPLDWLSGDENIQGVAIKLSFDSFFEALVPQAVNMSMGNKTLTQFYICLTGYYVERKYAFVTVSLQELLNISEDEIKIWGSLLTTWDNVYIRQIYDGNFTIITYNGILADTTDLLGSSPKIFFLLLLLNKVYLPEVDVAREQIISFSLENAFNLSKIQKELDISDYNSHFILRQHRTIAKQHQK